MRWLKKYETFNSNKRKENAFYILEPSKDENYWRRAVYDDEGQIHIVGFTNRVFYSSYDMHTKESIINYIKSFNDVFNIIGVWLKEGDVPTNTLFNAEIHINLAWNLNPSSEAGNLSNIKSEEPVNIFYHIYEDDSYLMSGTDCVEEIKIYFNDSKNTKNVNTFNSYNVRGKKFQFPIFNEKINKDTEKNFLNIILEKLNYFMTHNLSANIYSKGNQTYIDRYSIIYEIFTKAFKPDMTTEKLYQIVYDTLSNSPDSHILFNKLKGTTHYNIFQKIGGKNVDSASDMVDMGFAD